MSTPFGSTRNHRTSRGVALIASLLGVLFMLGGVRPLQAQGGAKDADVKAIQSYRLTESGLSKFMQATRNIAQAAKAHPEIANEQEDDGSDKSLDDMVAIYDRHPEIKHAITSTGMTSRDYVLFTFAMFQAGMAAGVQQMGGKLPEGVSGQNIEFYKKHEAELKKFGEEMQKMEGAGADTTSDG